MVKRKSFLLLMTVVLMMGLIIPSYADQVMITAVEEKEVAQTPVDKEMKITKEQALEKAKKALMDYFNLSLDDKKYNLQIENRRDWGSSDRYVWAMNWNYNDPLEYAYAYVTIDGETGEILEMNKDSGKNGQQNTKVTTLTTEEAREVAEKFIEKILPNRLKETALRENYDEYYRMRNGGAYPVYYYFNYVRLVDGIKYDGNYINVGMDGSTGEIKNFSYRWDKNELPKAENIIKVEEAQKIFGDNMRMDLVYLPIRDPMKYEAIPKRVKLVYRTSYDFGGMIDAKMGTIIGWDGKDQSKNMEKATLTEKQIKEILKNGKNIIVRDKEITKERATEVALKVLADEMVKDVKINNVSYMEGDGGYWEAAGKKAWGIDYSVEAKKDDEKASILPRANGRIVIDALTEQVLAFNRWYDYMGPYDSFEPAMTWKEAYDKAIAVIGKYYPDKIDQIKIDQVKTQYNEMINGKEMPPMEYYFYFPRKINGALYDENQISISFNNRNGQIQNISCRWNEELNFPSAKEALTEKQAKDLYFSYNGVELAYNQFNKGMDYQNPEVETKLIYRIAPKNPMINAYLLMDGLTGKPVDYDGKEIPIVEENNFEALVKDHWVEKTAKILAGQGIIEKDTFKPDQKITQLDAIKILVKSKGMDYYYPLKEAASSLKFSNVREDSEDFPYIQRAMIYGIIENSEGEFDAQKLLTREELSVMIVKLLKYDTLAQAKKIFTLSFEDKDQVSDDLTGYVAICEGLNIVDGTGKFRPRDHATMAETADMVYKSLGYLNR